MFGSFGDRVSHMFHSIGEHISHAFHHDKSKDKDKEKEKSKSSKKYDTHLKLTPFDTGVYKPPEKHIIDTKLDVKTPTINRESHRDKLDLNTSLSLKPRKPFDTIKIDVDKPTEDIVEKEHDVFPTANKFGVGKSNDIPNLNSTQVLADAKKEEVKNIGETADFGKRAALRNKVRKNTGLYGFEDSVKNRSASKGMSFGTGLRDYFGRT